MGSQFRLAHREALVPYFETAAEWLNLGPNCYDDGLWRLLGAEGRRSRPDPETLPSFFWQFARSRIDPLDVLRMGAEFLRSQRRNVRVFLNATVTAVATDPSGARFESVSATSVDGKRAAFKAKACVIAASAIENARLLLASRGADGIGLGNRHGVVGRYLCDHPSARIGFFQQRDIPAVMRDFGFYSLRKEGRTHPYMRGLTLAPDAQRAEGLLNCALYMMEERAPDDPFDALQRLSRFKSRSLKEDLSAILGSPASTFLALGRRLVSDKRIPAPIRRGIIDLTLATFPNFAASEFQSEGLPHKLKALHIDAIVEQVPDPENRITLSDKLDPLGVPIPTARWRVGELELHTLARLGQIAAEQFPASGLPAPVLADWIVQERLDEAAPIDMGHTSGTTRMSIDPKVGVVDTDCQVHGVRGLFIAGASVFPTSGHANPTLMITALALRLAAHLRTRLPDA